MICCNLFLIYIFFCKIHNKILSLQSTIKRRLDEALLAAKFISDGQLLASPESEQTLPQESDSSPLGLSSSFSPHSSARENRLSVLKKVPVCEGALIDIEDHRSVFAVRLNEDASSLLVGLDNEEIQLYRIKLRSQSESDTPRHSDRSNDVEHSPKTRTRVRLTTVLKVRNDTLKIS